MRYYNNYESNSFRNMEEAAMSPVERETTETSTQIKGTITNLVKLREEPTLDATVLEVLNKGQQVEIIDTHRDFYQVKVSGSDVKGYVASSFCKVV